MRRIMECLKEEKIDIDRVRVGHIGILPETHSDKEVDNSSKRLSANYHISNMVKSIVATLCIDVVCYPH